MGGGYVRSALDRFLLAFRRDRLDAAPRDLAGDVQLYWDDRPQFDRALQAEWEARRPGPFVGLCRVLELNGELAARTAARMARLQLAQGRFRSALETIRDPRFGLLADAAGQLDHARALLGLGQLRAARRILARAVELDGGARAEAGEIEPVIADLLEAERTVRRSAQWSDTRRLVDQWLAIGAAEAAGRALRAFLGRGQVADDELDDIHAALDTVLSLAPADGGNLVRALEPLYPGEAHRADLRLIGSVLAGEDDGSAPCWRADDGRLRTSGALAWLAAGKLPAAIAELGHLSFARFRDPGVRAHLARAIGRDMAARHPLRLPPNRGRRKIFDVIMFNNELRMLEIRLNEMADWVDHFVIVEARQTHAGADKPLIFEANRSRFSAFDDKIVHVVVDAFPSWVRHPWSREMHQRDMGVIGLSGRCAEDDLVIIADTDEIVSGEAVRGFTGEYASLAMERARYFLNYRQVLSREAQKETGSIWRARYLPSLGLSYARLGARDKKSSRLWDAGWHFTSILGAEDVVRKLRSNAHQEHASVPEADIVELLAKIRSGEFEWGWERCELDERFPAYIRRRRADFEDVLI